MHDEKSKLCAFRVTLELRKQLKFRFDIFLEFGQCVSVDKRGKLRAKEKVKRLLEGFA
jgi:hypothetical protein